MTIYLLQSANPPFLFRAVLATFAGVALACSGQAPVDVCATNNAAGNGNQNCAGGSTSQTGGSAVTGGSLASGGASLTAGTSNSGGTRTTGGSATVGGVFGSGGSRAGGGTSSTGGKATGGALATGGSAPVTGGASSTGGGTFATGGLKSTGGSTSTGGSLSTGGSFTTGGSTTGGTSTAGGTTSPGSSTSATGGVSTTGGTAGAGGTTSAGGTTNTCGNPLPGQDGSNPLNPTYYLVDESCYPTPTATAGFVDLEPVTYTYMNASLSRVTGTTSPARIFYSFIPAANNPKDAPILVVFNGGPAGSTTGVLFAFGTGPMTLHVDATTQDSLPKANPYSWANFGNLLYIDSRQAGFSYATTADPTNQNQRQAGYTADNFNFFGDAADFARVILRVQKAQPALQNNPVVIVAESYGGMRTSVMLSMLLDPVSIGQSTQNYFVDTALSQEIQAHFATVFKNEGSVPLSRARVARQFGWQILIEPAIDYADQWAIQNATPCDASYLSTQRLKAMGIACPPTAAGQTQAGILTNDWMDATSTAALLNPTSFRPLLGGVDPAAVAGLSSSTRPGAYRLVTDDTTTYPYDLASFTSTQGALPTYDRYYIVQNYIAYASFQITSPLTQLIGWYFLQNLLDVHTFMTRAALDFVIIPEVIPKSFMALDAANPVVSSVTIDDTQPAGVDRPGQMVFTYRDVASLGVTAGTQRTVRFPTYINSGHPVTVYQPAEIFADIGAFLTEWMQASP